jgi:hypothetical protein
MDAVSHTICSVKPSAEGFRHSRASVNVAIADDGHLSHLTNALHTSVGVAATEVVAEKSQPLCARVGQDAQGRLEGWQVAVHIRNETPHRWLARTLPTPHVKGCLQNAGPNPILQRKCDGRTGASAVLPVGPLTGENSTSPLT